MTGLAGRTALITGGGRGVGRAVAVQLARLGVRVAVLARTQKEVAATRKLIEEAGAESADFAVDIRQPEQLATAFSSLGTIDIVVNNAAVAWPVGRTAELPPELWLDAFSINLGGAFRCIWLALPGMVARDWGRIVNVTSGAGSPPGLLRASAYSASKAALNQLTLNLAAELAEDEIKGVTICAVDPGTVDTEMQRYMRHLQPDVLGPTSAEEFRHVHQNGLLQDPSAPAKLVAGAIAAAVSGEIIVMGTSRANAVMTALAEVE